MPVFTIACPGGISDIIDDDTYGYTHYNRDCRSAAVAFHSYMSNLLRQEHFLLTTNYRLNTLPHPFLPCTLMSLKAPILCLEPALNMLHIFLMLIYFCLSLLRGLRRIS